MQNFYLSFDGEGRKARRGDRGRPTKDSKEARHSPSSLREPQAHVHALRHRGFSGELAQSSRNKLWSEEQVEVALRTDLCVLRCRCTLTSKFPFVLFLHKRSPSVRECERASCERGKMWFPCRRRCRYRRLLSHTLNLFRARATLSGDTH